MTALLLRSRPTKRFKLAFTTLSMRRPCSQTQSKVLHKIRNRGYNIVNIPVSVMHVFMYKVSNSMFLRKRASEREYGSIPLARVE